MYIHVYNSCLQRTYFFPTKSRLGNQKRKSLFLVFSIFLYFADRLIIFYAWNSHNDDERFWSNATVDDWSKEMDGMRTIIEKYANITDNSVVGVRAPYLRVGGNNQFTMMEEQAFLYDSTITAPLSNPPLWPYTMYFKMPHRCHGNLQSCPTRSHAVWEMVMNELDRREDPQNDEYLPGCAMVDSCSNILSGEQFYNFLNHNFDRHYEQNRAPLGKI